MDSVGYIVMTVSDGTHKKKFKIMILIKIFALLKPKN